MRGAFAVTDRGYVVSPSAELLSTRNTQAIFSDAKALVKHHQLLFETLWNTAVSMQARIKELRQGTPAQVQGDALVILRFLGGYRVSPSNIYSDSGLPLPDAQAAISYLLRQNLVVKTSDGFTSLLEVTPRGHEIAKQGWKSLLEKE